MFETFMTVIGDVTTKPARRTLAPSGASLVEFGLLAKSRRYTRVETWGEDETLSMEVVCQRELAERVFASVSRGDPVIVHGRLRSRESRDPVTGKRRTDYEVEAHHVGHDLSRGTAVFSAGDTGALTWPDDGPPELDRVVTGFGLEGVVGVGVSAGVDGGQGERRGPSGTGMSDRAGLGVWTEG